mgnify:CR=1 FL=1
MFRPSAPTSLSLADSFTLGYVTASSSAAGFTPTMASSEGPLSITATLLCRLGLGCRSYNGPEQTARHRVRSCTFIARSPPLPKGIRKGYWALIVEGISPFPLGLPEVHTEFEQQVWRRLPSDPSLASLHRIIPPRADPGSFFGHPCLCLHIPSFQGLWLDLHQLVHDHAGRTPSVKAFFQWLEIFS